MSETWQTLQVARDARLEGRWDVASRLYDEVQPDFDYVKRTHRRTIMPFWFDDGIDEYDEPYEVESIGVQRAAWRAQVRAIDWLSWRDPLKTAAIDSVLKEMYSVAHISERAMAPMAPMAPNPLYSFLRRDIGVDAIEARIGSYANLIQPVAYGIFTVGSDDA